MDILQPLASFLLDTAAKGTVLLVLTGTAVWMLRLSSAAVRHSVWSLTMVSLILLPAAPLTLPSWGVAFLTAAEDVVPATLDSVAAASARSVQRNDPAAAPQAVVDATEISDPETVDRQTAAAVGVNLLPEDASEEKPATERGSEVAKPEANQKRAEDTNRMARNDDSVVPINSVIWWEKVSGLQVGFLLDSPGLPNRRVPFVSVVKYRILVRNTTDKDVTFMARPVPFDYRNAPYLIPAENITNALDYPELPREFRATDGRQGWKYELAYEMTLGGGESAIIPGHNGGNDLGLYVGNGDAKSLPKIAQIRAGMNWIVQPVQVWLSDEPGYGTGALFEGRYFQTKVDREGKTISKPATRMVVDKGGTVLYPRIQLEVGTLNAAAARHAKLATWGKVDKGLQCGIRLLSRRVSYEVGDTL